MCDLPARDRSAPFAATLECAGAARVGPVPVGERVATVRASDALDAGEILRRHRLGKPGDRVRRVIRALS